MPIEIIGGIAFVYVASLGAVYWVTKRAYDRKIGGYETLTEGVKALEGKKASIEENLESIEADLNGKQEDLQNVSSDLDTLRMETKDLQELRENAHTISEELEKDQNLLERTSTLLTSKKAALDELMSKVDLYSRVDELVEHGHFEMPDYLYDTSERFAAEIRLIRDRQKAMIKDGNATYVQGDLTITGVPQVDKRIISGQAKLLIRAFNIECDMLIGKVSPSKFDRTIAQIEKLAASLEKSMASLRCGISLSYLALKYEECGLQYQYALKKKEEQEEQKMLREQMREEAKAEKEYKAALEAAEKEEKMYRDILERARKDLEESSLEERALAEAKIAELEQRLAEAESKEERARSLAEQTRKGHVYVISNVGSFGENVYKIGMTRRLDPMDRVKELGDASVPFSFDVHAIIYADDAPALEAALHRRFKDRRVNAVNYRKEFFRVSINKIQEAVSDLTNQQADFRTTIAAEEYFESRRLLEEVAA
ncbi:DUF4041 domain-containing protein [Larsenimonas suaedae]|uniref:DUF4041 domain-containing protein n=1 Tax=Larsenimonas suaedae TaxID=1851019 RepID=A0ABU1GZ43_9GAMM|nr:DUF4041 domain-containing protein [Larsenimonas suaedae]MCM2973806.1 DUF4041 domain-containing protein [Larsenimonas suaedae]MDR5897330.1 DUF4041 domain-containing protein [Larsenimonas suaedae]